MKGAARGCRCSQSRKRCAATPVVSRTRIVPCCEPELSAVVRFRFKEPCFTPAVRSSFVGTLTGFAREKGHAPPYSYGRAIPRSLGPPSGRCVLRRHCLGGGAYMAAVWEVKTVARQSRRKHRSLVSSRLLADMCFSEALESGHFPPKFS